MGNKHFIKQYKTYSFNSFSKKKKNRKMGQDQSKLNNERVNFASSTVSNNDNNTKKKQYHTNTTGSKKVFSNSILDHSNSSSPSYYKNGSSSSSSTSTSSSLNSNKWDLNNLGIGTRSNQILPNSRTSDYADSGSTTTGEFPIDDVDDWVESLQFLRDEQ